MRATRLIPRTAGTSLYASDFNGMYAQLDLTHRVNEYVSYTLSGGRMITLAYAGGTLDEYFARLGANWNILHQVTLGTSFSYENGTYLSGYSETFDRYGFGVSVARGITSKLTASLAYQYYLRNSNRAGDELHHQCREPESGVQVLSRMVER